jgi:methoxymalonate biosynthesis acyl carrier protein
MSEQTAHTVPAGQEEVEKELLSHLSDRLGTPVAVDQDIFDAGLVSSMFAMELVVHLERTYGVSVAGADLRLDNFRTPRRMAALVTRLRDTEERHG